MIEIDEKIENLFHSRNNSPYGYLVILCQEKFYLFYVYEEDLQGCEKDLIWEYDYKFEKEVRKYGKILCVDFEDKCETFVTGTNSGWVCCWDIHDRVIKHSFRVVNPTSKRPEAVNLIRDINEERIIVTYSYLSQ